MTVSNFDNETFELRSDSLSILLVMGLGTVLCMFILALNYQSVVLDLRLIAVLASVGGLMLISFRLKKHHILTASWLFVIATALGPLLDKLMRGPSLYTDFFFIFQILAVSLQIGGTATFKVASVVTILMVVLATLGHDIVFAVSLSFVPTLTCLLVSVLSYLNEQNYLQMVHSAVDLQQKDTKRAETCYAPGDARRQPLLCALHRRSSRE